MKRTGLHANSSKAEEALRHFLSQVALPEKRPRYLDLISRPNSRRTFLDTIYHELEDHLDPAQRVAKLSADKISLPGFRFEPSNVFGEPIGALTTVCASFAESFLVVSTDGNIGIHGPESHIDGRSFYVA